MGNTEKRRKILDMDNVKIDIDLEELRNNLSEEDFVFLITGADDLGELLIEVASNRGMSNFISVLFERKKENQKGFRTRTQEEFNDLAFDFFNESIFQWEDDETKLKEFIQAFEPVKRILTRFTGQEIRKEVYSSLRLEKKDLWGSADMDEAIKSFFNREKEKVD